MMMRRQKRRRPLGLLVLAALIAAAIYIVRCGQGFGLGPGGGGDHADKAPAPDQHKAEVRPAVDKSAVGGQKAAGGGGRCHLRLDATGLHLEGKLSALDPAVKACAAAGGAELVATGDAVFGELERLRLALDQAGVKVYLHRPAGGGSGPGVAGGGGAGAAGGGGAGAAGDHGAGHGSDEGGASQTDAPGSPGTGSP